MASTFWRPSHPLRRLICTLAALVILGGFVMATWAPFPSSARSGGGQTWDLGWVPGLSGVQYVTTYGRPDSPQVINVQVKPRVAVALVLTAGMLWLSWRVYRHGGREA